MTLSTEQQLALIAAVTQQPVTTAVADQPIITEPKYQPDFYKIAEKMTAMGAYVVPVPTGQKACTLPDWQNKATRDLGQIEKWAEENQHYNCAIVGKPEIGAVWGFDDDSGVLAEYEAVHGPIQTYRTKTVSGGMHLLFRHNSQSIAMGNLSAKNEQNQELWSARTNNRYVISAGSVAHPHNDESQPLTAYTAIDVVAPIEAPDEFIEWLKQHSQKVPAPAPQSQDIQVHEGGRNNYLTSRVGKAHAAGVNMPELFAFALQVNEQKCVPPLSEKEVRTICESIGKRPNPEAGQIVFAPAQPQTVIEPVEITAIPYPAFPGWVFGGIPAYDKWVKPFCKINSRYPEYMMLPLMTLILNYLSTKGVRIEYKTFPLSIFLLLVGRKGRVIKSSSAQDAMEFCEKMGILVHAGTQTRNAEGRSVVFTVGSTEGLGLEMARINCKNAVLFYDEFSKTVAKMSIENSSFANDLSTMYESGKFANGTRSRKEHFSFDPGSYCSSFIGCTTDKRYPRLASRLFSSVDGMDERFFVLYQPEVLKEVEPMTGVPLPEDVIRETKRLVDKAIEKGIFSIEDSEPLRQISKINNRLEIRAEKWALAFAVLLGRDSIDESCIERGIVLAKYEWAVKKYLQVGESITREGGLQREIRLHVERAGGSMKLRDLQRKVSYDNYGTELWYRVYGGLIRGGILAETGTGKHGDPKIVGVLVPMLGDEED